jgi:tRNA dimethylallyltransferase
VSGTPPIVVLVGPTAVGKSRIALRIATEFAGEIVTADSRQVYRYMDIGTAKPSLAEQALARHYMIDLVEPSDTYSAQRFAKEGSRVLRAIGAAGRTAIVAGGTGFYVRALVDRPALPPVPPDESLRTRLRADAAERGAEALHAELARLDSASAQRIHPRNLPRVIRALEIVHVLGEPVPAVPHVESVPALHLGLTFDRGELDAVADFRVVSQIEAGLLDETRILLEMGYDPRSPALSGFAYREMVAYLEGRCTFDQAIADYQAATRRYIRRQLTWFRADARIRWFDPRTEEDEVVAAVAKYVAMAVSE